MLALPAALPSPTSSPTRSIAMSSSEAAPARAYDQSSCSSSTRETYIARLMAKFEASLDELGVKKVKNHTAKLQSMSNFIYESMSVGSRNYHSVQHVFNLIDGHVCGDLDAVAVLAALFHDCVYSSVDGGLSALQCEKLAGAIVGKSSTDTASSNNALRAHPNSMQDPLLRMVQAIFGFEANQVITGTGDNEFLSAVIAVRELQPLVSFKILIAIAVCIEATIPFRAVDDSGATALDRLYSRLVKANVEFSMGLTEAECIEAVQRAAMVANEDVGNFGTTDHALFLDNTWRLLPESNVALRSHDHYTVDQFRFAVFKMHGFFSFLKPEMVFQQFRGVPSKTTIARLEENAAKNIEVGGKYVATKLISASVVAAFAALTGGDAPIKLFMGRLPCLNGATRRLEDTLEDKTFGHPSCSRDCDPLVYQLLAEGRHQDMSFDVKQSPLAAYLYPFLGDSGVKRILDQFEVSEMTSETAAAFLSSLPREAVLHVAVNLADVAVSRKEQIIAILKTLPAEKRDGDRN